METSGDGPNPDSISGPDLRERAAAVLLSLLEQRTPVLFEPRGPSMNPSIRNGDFVRVRPVEDAAALRPGLIVLFQINDRLVLHRMIRMDKTGCQVVTCADAALSGHDAVPRTAIAGVAESVRRGNNVRRLDHSFARWAGLARYYLRPLRRAANFARRLLFRGEAPGG